MKDRQLEDCIRWMTDIKWKAKVFNRPTEEALATQTLKCLEELKAIKEKEEKE